MAMSEQGQADPASEAAERFTALGLIAGELIHDLANVVAVVHGRASLALGDSRAGRPPTAELERLVESSEDLSGMLRDVLEILRGAQVSPEVSFDPVRLIERTVRRFLDSAPTLDIRLVSTLAPGTQIPGRASFLSRSVLNLLNNAARYARSEIHLTLSPCEGSTPDTPGVLLVVEDDGPGVPPGLISGIFQPLVRGDTGGAAGLGLSSVSWAIRQLGGEVRYRTETLLGGAAFEVRLPAVIARPRLAVPDLEALAGCRMVLVEDDVSVQRALTRLLGRMGADVTPFNPVGASEEEILKALLAAMPDAILMDLRMGTREGGELWNAVRQQVPALARRVIFLSALAPGDREWDEAHATGQPVLCKPLDMAELSAALVHLLGEADA